MKIQLIAKCPSASILSLVACAVTSLTAAAQTATDFGYNRRPTGSARILLVILGRYTNAPFANFNTVYWDQRIFSSSWTSGLSDNEYFAEVANGGFRLARGGVVAVDLDPYYAISNLLTIYPKQNELVDLLHTSNIVHQAMEQNPTAFARYDSFPQDSVVTPAELLLLAVINYPAAAVRYPGRVRPTNCTVTWEGGVALQMDTSGTETSCHELCHALGAGNELYGIWGAGEQQLNNDLSLMSSGLSHLDPWNKMQFGWCEPEVRTIREGGVAVLPAASLTQSSPEALLLYDPARGLQEYLLLEYRTPAIGQCDDSVPGEGLVIWHVRQDADKNLMAYPDAAFPGAQTGWQFCAKCYCQVYDSSASAPCAAGGTHDLGLSFSMVVNVPADPGEHNWLYCWKCGLLFFGPNQASSLCPALGAHDPSASGDYSLRKNVPDRVGSHNWRRCTNCQALFLRPVTWPIDMPTNNCPATGIPATGPHQPGPDVYTLLARWTQETDMTRSAPDLMFGGSQLWGSGSTTPYLTWYDGSVMPTRIRVHPFSPGATNITVEWSAEGTWVDFHYAGLPELGTFEAPFNTLAEGVAAVAAGGTLHLKAGRTAETASINKPMTLEAYGGPVTIGR